MLPVVEKNLLCGSYWRTFPPAPADVLLQKDDPCFKSLEILSTMRNLFCCYFLCCLNKYSFTLLSMLNPISCFPSLILKGWGLDTSVPLLSDNLVDVNKNFYILYWISFNWRPSGSSRLRLLLHILFLKYLNSFPLSAELVLPISSCFGPFLLPEQKI